MTPTGPGPSERFGHGVALDGDVALVGVLAVTPGGTLGPGSAYAFQRDTGSWSGSTRLTSTDALAGDRFGSAVALDGALALIGAGGRDDACPGTDCDAGAAYFYRLRREPLGDFNLDGDIDFGDFSGMQECHTGPGPTTPEACCTVYDFDSDGDVDLTDFDAYLLAVTGP